MKESAIICDNNNSIETQNTITEKLRDLVKPEGLPLGNAQENRLEAGRSHSHTEFPELH